MCTLAISEDPDEMQHDAAFHHGLHCLLRLKEPSETKIHHNLENSTLCTCNPLKYTIGSPILVASICMGKSIRINKICCSCFKSCCSLEKCPENIELLSYTLLQFGGHLLKLGGAIRIT